MNEDENNIYGFSKEELEESFIPGTSEYWHALKLDRQSYKAKLHKDNTKILNDLNIPYVSKNMSLHYMIPFKNTIIDFYPTTGKIYDKSTGFKGKGIKTLLEYMEITEPGN